MLDVAVSADAPRSLAGIAEDHRPPMPDAELLQIADFCPGQLPLLPDVCPYPSEYPGVYLGGAGLGDADLVPGIAG